MRYRLRTLVIVMTLGGPLVGWSWIGWTEWRAAQRPACRPSLRQLSIALHNYHGDAYIGSRGADDETATPWVLEFNDPTSLLDGVRTPLGPDCGSVGQVSR
jgi:hypothetical protein